MTCVGGQGGMGGAGGTAGAGSGAENAGAGGAGETVCGLDLPCTGTFSTCSVAGLTCLCLGDVYVLCA